MSRHSVFAPSAAHRWMKCAPSIAAPPGRTSIEAAEGSVAHDMASTCLQTDLDAHQVWLMVQVATHDGFEIAITDEMRAYVQRYLDYVRGLGGTRIIEKRIEFTPELGGTPDALVLDLASEGNTLHVIDFKYGKGVRVAAEENAQMLTYAMMALADVEELIDITNVVLHVHQPRVDNVSAWPTTRQRVRDFQAELNDAMQRAKMFLNQEPIASLFDYVPGDHCKFCSLAGTCPGLHAKAVSSAQKVFGTAAEVPQSTLAEVLREAEIIDAWIAAVRKEAMDRAMRGEAIDGFKLVWKRPARKWRDEQKVIGLALDNLIDPFEKVLLSPAQMEKAVGKEPYADIFKPVVEFVSSGLALVSADDKRTAVDPITSAAERAAAFFSSIGE